MRSKSPFPPSIHLDILALTSPANILALTSPANIFFSPFLTSPTNIFFEDVCPDTLKGVMGMSGQDVKMLEGGKEDVCPDTLNIPKVNKNKVFVSQGVMGMLEGGKEGVSR